MRNGNPISGSRVDWHSGAQLMQFPPPPKEDHSEESTAVQNPDANVALTLRFFQSYFVAFIVLCAVSGGFWAHVTSTCRALDASMCKTGIPRDYGWIGLIVSLVALSLAGIYYCIRKPEQLRTTLVLFTLTLGLSLWSPVAGGPAIHFVFAMTAASTFESLRRWLRRKK